MSSKYTLNTLKLKSHFLYNFFLEISHKNRLLNELIGLLFEKITLECLKKKSVLIIEHLTVTIQLLMVEYNIRSLTKNILVYQSYHQDNISDRVALPNWKFQSRISTRDWMILTVALFLVTRVTKGSISPITPDMSMIAQNNP